MSAAVLVLHLLATTPAFEARPEIDPDAPTWYGWQPLLADATAASLMGGGIVLGGVPNLGVAGGVLIVSGVGIYLFGGPAMHLLRERPRAALLDLGMRVLFPLGGFLGGLLLGILSSQPAVLAVGFIVGLGSAILVDVASLSWEPPERTPAPPADSTTVRWTPFLGATRRGAPLAGVAARF